jgi:DNA replication protein DnaC
MRSDLLAADPKCPACGAPATIVSDAVLHEDTAFLVCGCYDPGDYPLAEAVPPPRPIAPPCAFCGAVETRTWFAAAKRWRYVRECAADCGCPACIEGRRCAELVEARRLAEIVARERDKRGQRLGAAGIPRAYEHCEIATYQALPEVALAKEQVLAFAARLSEHLTAGRGLWFIGPTGTGKTHLAVAVLRLAIDAGWGGLYCWTRDYLRDLRGSYDDRRLDPLPRLLAAPVLLLDDVGEARVDRNPEHVREALIDVLGHRHMDLRPTLVTTNRTRLELREDTDERITSRLAEMCQVVVMDGPDYRLREDA